MSQIKERPILFSAPMVRAILDGRKTVTRLTMSVQPELDGAFWKVYGAGWGAGISSVPAMPGHSLAANCPIGMAGERLWVQEAWAIAGGMPHDPGYVVLRSEFDGDYDDCGNPVDRWRPAETMDRDDCRVELEITSVRIERLQDISRADIRAEGLQCPPELASDDVSPNYRDWYPAAWKELWNSTGGDWDANPWVWVVEFKRVTP
ncbi:hypothetical protein [Pseudomonas koreensis]|uniref:hypothetical protein n=1 Tax=Pseudomonas koreensis TaxID=198620 RepID=UPI001330A2EE|nr:hypothetical protein [Pseudomonas koreensis]